jgi:hypothetical protein
MVGVGRRRGNKKKTTNKNAVIREGVGLPLWTGWVGREAICVLLSPLLLQMAFVFAGIVVGAQGFADSVYCVGEAC